MDSIVFYPSANPPAADPSAAGTIRDQPHHSAILEAARQTAEFRRLLEDARREVFWKLWGPYLAERQWGTVREDYSAEGDVWASFPFDHAHLRAYRWGEDGLLGWTDHECRLCFGLALWNGRDPILKERLFGLSGPEGNHGEDVKEIYHYLESTPTHSYARAVYYYPQGEFPYRALREENARRSRAEREWELPDTGVLADGRFFEITIEYAKESPTTTLIALRLRNCNREAATVQVLPQLWFRNSWSWGATEESAAGRPVLWLSGQRRVTTKHPSLAAMEWHLGEAPERFLFTENETNRTALYGAPNPQPYVKDAFHRCVVQGEEGAVNPAGTGTKVAAWYGITLPGGGEKVLRFRLGPAGSGEADCGHGLDKVLAARRQESREFHEAVADPALDEKQRLVVRQALSGLLWSKQFYALVQTEWEQGDPAQPPPPPGHRGSRNPEWRHLFLQDVLLMPDKWEYPYFCAWDLAFHTVSVSRVDPFLAKEQLDLLTREWVMHPNGQFPAYEWNFSDVNPPVHSWAVWRLYRLPLLVGGADRDFLERQFLKALLNFTWWVNRKDPNDRDLFSGGFLGFDNIGVFDRSKPLPTGGNLKQADGTAWMAFYCIQMLMMALELAQQEASYETLASKFFQHFIRICHAMNNEGGTGLWDTEEGFYYDQLEIEGEHQPLRVRSLVGLVPLLAVALVPKQYLEKLPEFRKRVLWFLRHRTELTQHLFDLNQGSLTDHAFSLLALPSKERLQALLRALLDEEEFLSPYGIRSLSRRHCEQPYVYWVGAEAYAVDYEPGESHSGMFGGNSNWRGPIWLPMNYLLIEALRVYHRFYGPEFLVEFPTRSGNWVSLGRAAHLLTQRLAALFLPESGTGGTRPCLREAGLPTPWPGEEDRLLFYEFFDGETGRGCGASHQTGWSALIADLLNLSSHWQLHPSDGPPASAA